MHKLNILYILYKPLKINNMIENKPIENHKWMNRYAFFSLQKYMNNPLGKINYARNKTKKPWLALRSIQKQL